MNLDDKSLFLGAMEDVQPLKRHNDVHWHPERKTRAVQRVDTLQLDNFLTTGYLDIVPLATALEFKREGLQSGVLEKLRRGKYGQQASLNLLRQPVEKCRQMLFAFVVQARKEGLRNVLIVHGKGRDDNAHANITGSATLNIAASASAASVPGLLFVARVTPAPASLARKPVRHARRR